jgi:hypothetical protein
VKLGGVIDDLIHRQRDEILEHDVDDGPHPTIAAPTPTPQIVFSLIGRVAHALASEFLDEALASL